MTVKSAKFNLTAMILTILAFPGAAQARGGGGGEDLAHSLSLADGIASPASNLGLDDNPAGLVYNSQTSIHVAGLFNPGTTDANARLLLGNGSVGGGLGYSTQNRVSAGLAATIPGIDTSIGVKGVWDTSSGGGGWDGNLGAIFHPQGEFRVGAEVFGLNGGIHGLGAGIAYDLQSSATLGVDAGADQNLKGLVTKPALGIHLSELQLTIAYGFRVGDGGASPVAEGTSAGLGFNFGGKYHVSAYYQHIARYFAGLTIDL